MTTSASPEAGADLADLTDRVAGLEELVAEVVDQLTARRGAGPWFWERLTRERAAALWDQLAEFVAYLSRRYLAEAPDTYRLPGCWYRHPVAVEQLTALMVAHDAAYGDVGAEPSPALVDWHERSLWPTLDRLRDLKVFARCDNGHQERTGSRREPWRPDETFGEHVAAVLPAQEGS